MKIKLELYGASRAFSSKDHLEFDLKEPSIEKIVTSQSFDIASFITCRGKEPKPAMIASLL